MPNVPTKRSTLLLLLLLLAPIALAGCQTLKSMNPFANRETPYRSAQQEQPLAVPPSLDQPATREALVIPQGGPRSRRGLTVDPQSLQGLPGAKSESSAATTGTLTVSGDPESVYQRVGVALARNQVGQVAAHDDVDHSYKIVIKPNEPDVAQAGFFAKVYHRNPDEVPGDTVTLEVAKHGRRHSVVSAHGDPASVARIMAVLKESLK